MLAVGRGVEHEVERLRDRADALQGAPQERGQVGDAADARGSGALERGLVAARHDPGFVGDARSIGTESDVVAANLDDAQVLPFFLREDVAKDAALLAFESSRVPARSS